MNVDEYVRYDAVGLAELLKDREVSARELNECARSRAEAANPKINAIVELFDDDRIISDECSSDGVFAGVPFLIKDLVLQAAGYRHEMGSRLLSGHVAEQDSELMRRFRAAGFATMGRTAVPEFGLGVATESTLSGITRNPWNLERSAGGSSGGSAAAVAAGVVPIAHANDGGGSIRCPAACCGLIGLKPTRGRITAGPFVAEGLMGFGAEFAVTRSVRDTAALLDAVQGSMVGDPYDIAAPVAPYSSLRRIQENLRVAVCTDPWWPCSVDEEILAATLQIAELMEELGHNVESATPRLDEPNFSIATTTLWSTAIAQLIQHLTSPPEKTADESTLEPQTIAVNQYGLSRSATDLLDAKDVFNRVSRDFGRFFEHYDLLLTPTVAQLAWPAGEQLRFGESSSAVEWLDSMNRLSPFTTPFNCTGQPAISLPMGQSGNGLPIGVQFVAPFGREDRLLEIATQLHEARPWPEVKVAVDSE